MTPTDTPPPNPATPHQQPPAQQLLSPPQPHTPTPAPTQAVSLSNRRDLKSWWKAFKVQGKNQDAHGIASPSPTSLSSPLRSESVFSEDLALRHVQSGRGDNAGDKDDNAGNAGNDGVDAFFLDVLRREDIYASAAAAAAAQSSEGMPRAPKRAGFFHRVMGYLLLPFNDKRYFGFRRLTRAGVIESRPQGIFGVPLRQSITYANVAISLVDENGKSYIYGYVPIVVAKCGVFLKEKATSVEGIFRLSGSEKRIKELKQAFDSPDRYGKGLVWDGYTVHDAANVLRRYLNDLPEPVVPLDLYEKFREPLRGATKQAVGDNEGPQFVENFDMNAAIIKYQQLITELPPLNRQLLLYILDLLAVFAAKSDENRMTSQNLAAIFQPGMLSHPNHAMAPEEYRLNQCVIIFLIENQDHFLIGMQGTAADEKTVQAVQKGTPPPSGAPPATPSNNGASRSGGGGVSRSASTASAGAESVARDGKIRRNRSTSSRHSRQSNGGAPSPGSPAVVSTPNVGLTRSNTVPSKKSPALGSGRFAKRAGEHPSSPVAPLTPLTQHAPAPGVPAVEETVTPPEEEEPAKHKEAGDYLTTQAAAAAAERAYERQLLTPGPEVVTPSKEKKFQNPFQRTPVGEGGDVRQPNKLRKKRLPGSTNPSAQSSTASLSHHSAAVASPSHEAADPMVEYTQGGGALENHQMPVSSVARLATETPSEPTPRASQVPSSANMQPGSSESMLKPKKSPPTSLHSSFNEGSDPDHVDELAAPAENPEPEKAKKRLWRLSRRREDNGQLPPPNPAGVASPRQVLGANGNAEGSSSSVGSAGNKARRSFTGDSSDPALAGTEAPSFQDLNGKDLRDDREEGKGLTRWLKNKYREAKETAEQRRNKSPPADRSSLAPGSIFAPRGKSLDIKRSTDEEKLATAQGPQSPQ